MTAVAIALGGAIGALARWGSTRLAQQWLGDSFPWGTLFVNLAGCFALAYLGETFVRKEWSNEVVRDGVSIGLLGAYTTFSTFGVDTLRSWERGAYSIALANLAANLVLGLAACALGAWYARY